MRKLIFLIVMAAMLMFSLSAQEDVNYTKDYIDALQKSGQERIDAMKSYIQKYPDTTSSFTRLAYYWLALDYYQTKNYSEAIRRGEARLKMGEFGTGEEARLTLVLANCYGIKSAPEYNQQKALQLVSKAVILGKEAEDKDLVKTAEDLRDKLSGPVAPAATPEQKLKRAFSTDDFSEVLNIYKTLPDAQKNDPEIHKLYATSLEKTGKLDAALQEYTKIYEKSKTGANGKNIADIFEVRMKRDKTLLDQTAEWYVKVGHLYQKEKNTQNANIAYQKALAILAEKYDFEKQRQALEATMKKGQASSQQNQSKITALKKDIRKIERDIQKYEMDDMDAPQYLYDNVTKMKNQIKALEAGGSSADMEQANKLNELRKKIDAELTALKQKVKI